MKHDPHSLIPLIRVLLPLAEVFEQAAPDALLITKALKALRGEGAEIRTTLESINHLSKAHQKLMVKALAADLARRYGNQDEVEFWNVIVGEVRGLPLDAPLSAPKVRAKAQRPDKRVSAHDLEQRMFIANDCSELIATIGLDDQALVVALESVGLVVTDTKRLQSIRTGRMARTAKKGVVQNVWNQNRLQELKTALELVEEQKRGRA